MDHQQYSPFPTPGEWFRDLTARGRAVLFVFLGVLALLACLYGWAFGQQGISFEGGFLRQRETGGMEVYRGRVQKLPVTITVLPQENGAILRYEIGGRPAQDYEVSVTEGTEAYYDPLLVTRNGVVHFQGFVNDNRRVGEVIIFDQDTEMTGWSIGGTRNADDLTQTGYTPSIRHMVATAEGLNHRIRGDKGLLAAGLVLLALCLAELFFSNQRFRREARFVVDDSDAEPSDWYRLQRGCLLFLAPAGAVLLLLLALFT